MPPAAGYQRRMDDTDLLELAIGLAFEAGAAIMTVRARGFDVTRKADASPVTEADTAAEAIIVTALRRATPDIPVIAEEEVAAGRITEAGAAFWLVDPLDGTREFAKGLDEFAVNVGLVRNGRPVLGAVGAPAWGAVYGGIVGQGAILRDASGERAIAARRPPAEGLAVLASRHHGADGRMAEFLAGRRIASVTGMGSALKFCRLAEGAADLYPRFGRTMEWDTAAPHAVLAAAGGEMCRLDGAPFMYGKPGWENPGFVCTGL